MPEPSEVPLDLHTRNVAPFVAHKLGVPGLLLLTINADGTTSLMAHGVNHAVASMMLSRAVQMNLNQHDEFVRLGHAGDAAQAQQAFIDADAVGAVQ